MSNSLVSSVRRVLLSSGLKKIKPIRVGSNQIKAGDYIFLVGTMLMIEKPDICYSSNLKTAGAYETGTNSLWFKFPAAHTLAEEAIVVHEATHAVFDLYSTDINIGDAETIAYIAQCQYFIINNDNPDVRLMDDAGEGTRKDDVFRLATDVAGTLLSNKTPTKDQYHELRQAVSNDPDYYHEFFTKASYDGIVPGDD